MVKKYIKFFIKNYLFALISLIFALLYWLSAKDLPDKSLTFPKPVLICMIPIICWNFIKSVKEFKVQYDESPDDAQKWNCSLHINAQKLIIAAMTLLYVILLPHLGFIVCTSVYLAGMAYYLGVRKPIKLVLFVVIFTIVVYAIFGMWLNVRLPHGIFF